MVTREDPNRVVREFGNLRWVTQQKTTDQITCEEFLKFLMDEGYLRAKDAQGLVPERSEEPTAGSPEQPDGEAGAPSSPEKPDGSSLTSIEQEAREWWIDKFPTCNPDTDASLFDQRMLSDFHLHMLSKPQPK